MKHTEYIVPIGEEAKEFDEMFIGVIRRQPELIRCKDCKFRNDANCERFGIKRYTQSNSYCSWAERKEE